MKKDIEWLKGKINAFQEGENMFTAEFNAGVQDALEYVQELISQLDETEVLSEEWIDDESMSVVNTFNHHVLAVSIYKLQNLLVPKQELPVIPKFVADYIKECKRFDESGRKSLYTAIDSMPKEVSEWMTFGVEGFGKGQELFARAWLDGFTVEKEQKYVVKLPMSKNNDNQYAIVDYLGNIWTDALPSKYKITEEEIRGLTKGDVLFEHFAVKVEEEEE